MSLILPKGLVVNSPEIRIDIERINTEPLDPADIAKFWKVYTTTKRRLLDPTAERLENYWWRIWGSQKRTLNGATVARLFAHISDGQTSVPLRGPPNRDEGSPLLNTAARRGPGASSTTALHRSDQSRPSTTSSSTASRNPVPMPHPILKKTRGPSTSGPRPTARFISPPESDGEADPSSSVSTNSQTNSHVVVEPPSPDSQHAKLEPKSSPSLGKKKGGFVASARKKRPVIVRRQNSQNSQSSTEAIPSISTVQSSSEKTPPTFSEPSRNAPQSRFQENFTPSPDRSKSAKKRNTIRDSESKRSPPGKLGVPREGKGVHSDKTGQRVVLSGDPGPSTQLRRIENLQHKDVPSEELTAEELGEIKVQETLLAEANARVKKEPRTAPGPLIHTSDGFRVLHRSLRPQSDGTREQKAMGAVQLLDHETKGTASLAPTLADATGQVDLGNVGAPSAGTPAPGSNSKEDKGKGRESEGVPRTDMFAKRPVQPMQAAAILDSTESLTRSKSQLTLLLERDRARSGEHKSDDEKGNPKKR